MTPDVAATPGRLRPDARLALLALRRTASPLVLLALAAAAALALRSDAAAALPGAAPTHGAVLASAWTLFLVLVAPLGVLRAASLVDRREAQWIATARLGPLARSASCVLGAAAAGALLAFAWALVALAAGGTRGATTLERAGQVAGPAEVLVAAGGALAWSADVAPTGALRARVDLSLELSPGGGGTAVLRARRGGVAREGRAFLQPRGGVEVEVPPGAGPVAFELTLADPDARGFLTGEDVSLWREAGPRAADLRLALRCAAALCAWCALAAALAAWLHPATVVLALLSGWIALGAAGAPAWVPGADLAAAIATSGSDRAPAAAGPLALAALALVAALAIALGARREGGR